MRNQLQEFEQDDRDFALRTEETARLVDDLHRIVDRLAEMHPGRHFPLDGHLVGSIGEAAAEAMFALRLQPSSTTGHDAIGTDGRTIEIKATYGNRTVAMRRTSAGVADCLIVLRLSRQRGSTHEVVYNGPLASMHHLAGQLQSNGASSISLSKLRAANFEVSEADRVVVRPTLH